MSNPSRPGPLPIETVVAILDGLPALISLWDADSCNRFANIQLLARLGKSRDDLIGRPLRDVFDSDSLGTAGDPVAAAMAGHPQRFDRRLIERGSGEWTLLQIDLMPVLTDDHPSGIVLAVTDVSERLSVESAVHSSGRRLAAIRERSRVVNLLNSRALAGLVDIAAGLTNGLLVRWSDAVGNVRTAQDQIDNLIADLRATSRDLRGDRLADPAVTDRPEAPETTPGTTDPAATDPAATDVTSKSWLPPAMVTPHRNDGLDWRGVDLAGVLDAIPVGVAVLDEDLDVVFVNHIARDWLGLADADLGDVGTRLGLTAPTLASLSPDRVTGDISADPMDVRITSAGETPRTLRAARRPVDLGGRGTGHVVLLTDLTARDAAVRAAQGNRAAAAALIERTRIADGLHATLIQRLYAIGLTLESSLRSRDPAVAVGQVQGAIEAIQSALDELSEFLHTAPVDTSRDVDGHIQSCLRFAARSLGLTTIILVDGSPDVLPPDIVRELVAVLDRLLADAAAAQATDVTVRLSVLSDGASLTVLDNGHRDRTTTPPELLAAARFGPSDHKWVASGQRDDHGVTIRWTAPERRPVDGVTARPGR